SFILSISNIAEGDHQIDVRVLNSVENPSEPLSFDFNSQLIVPEPGTALLALLGCLTLIATHRRRIRGTGVPPVFHRRDACATMRNHSRNLRYTPSVSRAIVSAPKRSRTLA
ncbi:MAG: PEP-CTERM sorting domain-containing protein, partial [Planctomycetes bacterium]|nr:PEP-CTERM sorting domain-containing protein [Planctomycetota bacterium]